MAYSVIAQSEKTSAVRNKSYTVVKAVDKLCERNEDINEQLSSALDRKDDSKSYSILLTNQELEENCKEACEIPNEQITNIICLQQKSDEGENSTNFCSDLGVDNKSGEDSNLIKEQLPKSIPQHSTNKNKSYTIFKEKGEETKTPTGEENNHKVRIRNQSYTVIQPGVTDSTKNGKVPKTIPDVKGIESENEDNFRELSENKDSLFIYQTLKFNEFSKDIEKRNIIRNKLKGTQNAKHSIADKSKIDFLCKDIFNNQNKRAHVKNENKENSIENKELHFKTEKPPIYNDPRLKSNYRTNKHWHKLQLSNRNVKQYILQNSDQNKSNKIVKGIKRKPLILENSSVEYRKTKCDINIPRLQFATIIPPEVQNNILWYYEAADEVFI